MLPNPLFNNPINASWTKRLYLKMECACGSVSVQPSILLDIIFISINFSASLEASIRRTEKEREIESLIR